jgi:WD40 repeat protein
MAMEYRQVINDAHPKPILCTQYNPFRREIYTAGEDTFIKVWESESGKLIAVWSQHIGWVTSLLYWLQLFDQVKKLKCCSRPQLMAPL